MQNDGEDLGTVLLSVLSYAEREHKSELLERAMKAAEVALLEIPDAHETPSLLHLSRWCRQKQALDALLSAMSRGPLGHRPSRQEQ